MRDSGGKERPLKKERKEKKERVNRAWAGAERGAKESKATRSE